MTVVSSDYFLPSGLTPVDPTLGRLLPLFPSAKPAQIPVRVALPDRAKGASEKTTIVYKGRDTAIFFLNFPLHGGDAVKLRTVAASRETPAQVVAMMPNDRGSAVAVRFTDEVPTWLRKA